MHKQVYVSIHSNDYLSTLDMFQLLPWMEPSISHLSLSSLGWVSFTDLPHPWGLRNLWPFEWEYTSTQCFTFDWRSPQNHLFKTYLLNTNSELDCSGHWPWNPREVGSQGEAGPVKSHEVLRHEALFSAKWFQLGRPYKHIIWWGGYTKWVRGVA